jgi:hypothetical protein
MREKPALSHILSFISSKQITTCTHVVYLLKEVKDLQRRIYRGRRTFAPRRAKRWQWQRLTVNNVGPIHAPNANMDDLLATFKTAMGITLNLPDIVIWRILIKIAIKIGFNPNNQTSNTGVLLSLFVDDPPAATFQPVTQPFSQRYLMWDEIYTAEGLLNSVPLSATPGNAVLYKTYDVRSHRKLDNVNSSLWLTLSETGNAVLTDYSYTASILMKMP